MIYLYSGTPGSGKSLYSAYEICDRLKYKKRVIANFNINFAYFKKKAESAKRYFTYCDNSELTPEFLVEFAKQNHKEGKESQTVIIIDECSILFNPREWDKGDRLKWIVFFQQHRKLGYDVILITQNDRLIDRQIRSFIETEYKYRRVKNYKLFGAVLDLLSGGLFIRVEYWYGTRLRCSSQWFRLNKRKSSIYNTFDIFKKE